MPYSILLFLEIYNNMKKIFILLLLACSFQIYAQQHSFTIHGKVPGLKKGMTVSVLKAERDEKSDFNAEDFELGLIDLNSMPQETSELATTTVTKNGEFQLTGTVDHPQLCTLITNNMELIEKKNKGKSYDGIRWTYTPVFVDNTDMEVIVANYDLWTDEPITDDFKIIGGTVQNDFNEYNLMIKAAGDTSNDETARFELDKKFIESHPSSVISLYLANNILTNGYNLTKDQISFLQGTIKPCTTDTARYNTFLSKVKTAELTAVGNPVVNLDIKDDKGTATTLTDVIPKSKLVLVDFWASWCGICRASTPGIKKLYSKYPREEFDVISVSCDTYHENWVKAMETDNMPWKQYLLTPQGYKDFFAKYQLIGVPYYLLVDANGHVIGNPGGIEHIKEVVKEYCK